MSHHNRTSPAEKSQSQSFETLSVWHWFTRFEAVRSQGSCYAANKSNLTWLLMELLMWRKCLCCARLRFERLRGSRFALHQHRLKWFSPCFLIAYSVSVSLSFSRSWTHHFLYNLLHRISSTFCDLHERLTNDYQYVIAQMDVEWVADRHQSWPWISSLAGGCRSRLADLVRCLRRVKSQLLDEYFRWFYEWCDLWD